MVGASAGSPEVNTINPRGDLPPAVEDEITLPLHPLPPRQDRNAFLLPLCGRKAPDHSGFTRAWPQTDCRVLRVAPSASGLPGLPVSGAPASSGLSRSSGTDEPESVSGNAPGRWVEMRPGRPLRRALMTCPTGGSRGRHPRTPGVCPDERRAQAVRSAATLAGLVSRAWAAEGPVPTLTLTPPTTLYCSITARPVLMPAVRGGKARTRQ